MTTSDKTLALLKDAQSLSPEARERWLDRLATADPAQATTVRRLLGATASPATQVLGAPGGIGAAQTLEFRRLGAYRLLSRIGQGGMGEVWLAERADLAYAKQVAIKLIATRMDNQEAVEWFRRERQALAKLEHPHIARLLDGGETDAGQPYLVMEHVQGVPIDAYCEGKPIDVVLALFLQVCSAVEHAHRQLIVHRDIKPANVLVTAEGQTRLLDFGIAKEMGPASAAGERADARAYTLHYASPEQMEGGDITVASDVYSLGALLYRLLSGRVSYANATDVTSQLAAMHGAGTDKPSAVVLQQPGLTPIDRKQRARRLHGDLDEVVLKCLHRDPARRYGSARELSEDIGRYQRHEPVLARGNNAAYTASRFLRRHWLAVGASLALILTLSGGLLATLWQARLAEKRFDLSRELVNDVIFDFQDRLALVPGTIGARRHLVARTKRYLDKIALDAQGDPGLLLDLSIVERRMGDIAGNPLWPNLGDRQAAGQHYQRAVDQVRRSLQLRPDDAAARLALARALNSQATFLFWGDDLVQPEKLFGEAITHFEGLLKAKPSPTVDLEMANAMLGLGDVYFWNSELERALAMYDRACQARVGNPSTTWQIRDFIGGCHVRRADALAWLERGEASELEIARAIAVYAPLHANAPNNNSISHAYVVALVKQGEILQWNKKLEASLAAHDLALRLSERQSTADALDLRAVRNVAMARNKRGDVFTEMKRFDAAIAEYQMALKVFQAMAAKDLSNPEHARDIAKANKRLGDAHVGNANLAAAAGHFDAALATMRKRWQHAPAQAVTRRDLAVALEDRITAAPSPALACRLGAESLQLLESLDRETLLTPADQPFLIDVRKRASQCQRSAGGPAAGG